jgi:phosphomannomutase/phosphoglucomutase
MLVLTLLLILGLMQWFQSGQQAQLSEQQAAFEQQRFNSLLATLSKAIQREQQQLNALAASAELKTTLSQNEQTMLSAWQQQTAQSLPSVERICVLLTLPQGPENSDCLSVTFATLATLRQLQDQPQSDIAMMQPGSDTAHIVLAQRVESLPAYPEASLVMVLKPSWLDEQIDDSFAANGYIEISQGQSSAIALTAAGQPQYKQGQPLFSQPLANSAWTVHYWVQTPASAVSMLLMPLVAAVLLIMWLLRDWILGRVLKSDTDILQQQLTDLEQQELKPEYALTLTGLQQVSDHIHRLIIPERKTNNTKAKLAGTAPESEAADVSPDAQAETIVEQALAVASKSEGKKPPAALPDEAIFRHYDIRGKVGPQLNAGVMQQLGQAVGSEALDQSQSRLVLGRDGRLSSDSLAEAFIRGVLSSGCDVIDIGQVPTPMVYFACEQLETHTGAMITGSHNPVDYNGLKVVIAGKTLLGDSVHRLYARIRDKRLKQGQGQLSKESIKQAYIDRIQGEIKLSRKMNIVVDSGNGVAGSIAPDLFRALGCEVTELYCEVDGRFPHHHPDPGQPENMQDLIKVVKSQEAELGLAYDGDGDRLGVVDGDGNIIWPDRLLLLMAQYLLVDQPGATILYDVKSTNMLEEVISRAGGTPIMTPSGHSVIKHLMQEHGAMLAGEMTGHFFFRDRWYGFDDALYSAARLLELLAADPLERTPTEVFAALPSRVSTPEIIVEMAEGESHRFIEQLQANVEFVGGKLSKVDGVRVDYPTGWGLVRASNTVPGLTLRFEATTKEELEHIKQQFIQQMLQIKPTLSLLF